MYMYMYICIYTHVYIIIRIYVYTYMHIHKSLYIYIYTHTHTHIYMYIYTHIYIYTNIPIHIPVCALISYDVGPGDCAACDSTSSKNVRRAPPAPVRDSGRKLRVVDRESWENSGGAREC